MSASTDPAAPAGVRTLNPTVAIVGAGPSGLRAATELAPHLPGQVLVLDREAVAGGIPRHSDHTGYGLRDLHTCTTGPRYAARLRETAAAAGATIMTRATVTGWAGERTLEVTSPQGRLHVRADAVVLATGARERPRPARLIPGDRAAGVLTTGQLQNIVHLQHGRVGRRAVVVGSELVSWSAVMTLRHAGARTVLMTTEYPRPDSYALFHRPGRLLFGVTPATRTRVVRVLGRPAVTGVEIEDLDTGARRVVDCDTVVLTGDWIPDNELARAAGLEIDRASRAPLVDGALRTARPGVFAAGNVLHPVDTADVAALDGAAVAAHVLDHLAGRAPAAGPGVRLRAAAPLRWVSPGLLRPGPGARPPRGRLLAWADELHTRPTVVLTQDGREIAARRLWWPAAPGRVLRIPAGVLDAVDPAGGEVTVGLR